MNHRSGLRKLNITDGAHRRAMLRNMGNALIRHERIKTTAVRAKELRKFIEPIITISKKPSLANRRLVFSRLRDRENVSKLFSEIGIRCANRNGGYLRILKCGFRAGDNAMMAFIEFVDKPAPTATPAPDKSDKANKAEATDKAQTPPATEAATTPNETETK